MSKRMEELRSEPNVVLGFRKIPSLEYNCPEDFDRKKMI